MTTILHCYRVTYTQHNRVWTKNIVAPDESVALAIIGRADACKAELIADDVLVIPLLGRGHAT